MLLWVSLQLGRSNSPSVSPRPPRYLFRNQFTGTIPDTVGNMTGLRRLYVSLDALSCSLAFFCSFLHVNQLTGSIPETVGQMRSITHIYLNNNSLTGPIPSAIVQLTDLESLYARTAPDRLISLTPCPDCRNLHFNQFTGTMPSLSTLSKLSSW